MLSHFLGVSDDARSREVANYLRREQRADGTWAIYHGGPADLNATVEAYFALKLAGASPDEPAMRRAREWILSAGGVPEVRVFTKIWLALFGQWDWRCVPVLPPEIILLPRWCPLNIYDFAAWARSTIVPMLIILSERPTCPVPDHARIDELFQDGRQGTDYGLPAPRGSAWASLFHRAERSAPPRRALRSRRDARGGLPHRGGLDRRPPGGRWRLGRHPAAVGLLAHRAESPRLSARSPGDEARHRGVRDRMGDRG